MSTERIPACLEVFRDETAHRASDARELRARVLCQFRERRSRRKVIPRLIPLVAVLAGTGALAATAARHVRPLMELVARLRAPEPVANSKPSLERHFNHAVVHAPEATTIVTPANASSESAIPTKPDLTEPTNLVSRARSPVGSDVRVKASSMVSQDRSPVEEHRTAVREQPFDKDTTAAPRAPTRIERDVPDELSLYRRAHDLYFRGGSPAQAAAAFHAYLDAFPRGALSLEARFNEGACLARLGRTQEAARFLEPFANGTHGEYMKREAKDLLRSLAQPAARK